MTNATLKKIAAAKSYSNLVHTFPPRIVRSKRERQNAYRIIDYLMSMKNPSRGQLEFLELLSTLVEDSEAVSHPTPDGTIASLLNHLLESKGESQAELAKATGIPKSIVSEIIAGRRGLSVSNMKRLAAHFSVDASLFLQCSD